MESRCDVIALGLKSNYLDGYEYLVPFRQSPVNYTGYSDPEVSDLILKSQSISDVKRRAAEYRKIAKKIEEACVSYPIVDQTMKYVYVKKNLNTPGIGKVTLNDYYFGNASWTN